MITVSAETGIENKMTCLETRKGRRKQFGALASDAPLCREKGRKWASEEVAYGRDRDRDREEKWLCIVISDGKLCVQSSFLTSAFSQCSVASSLLSCVCVCLCASLVFSWGRECPQACWGRQANPWRNDTDLSPTSDPPPFPADRTATKTGCKILSEFQFTEIIPYSAKLDQQCFINNGLGLKIAHGNGTTEWLNDKSWDKLQSQC